MAESSLSFTFVEGVGYQAEKMVSGDYALHLERKRSGFLNIFQRSTSTGAYAECNVPGNVRYSSEVVDYVFGHGVYPMYIRIISESEVVTGSIREVEV